ncbi:MAG: IgGFc-binding protein [Deltaproteobacteria bacterium]|nr:IgGFc-binding protein [Deltaproteobacteria bacterium]
MHTRRTMGLAVLLAGVLGGCGEPDDAGVPDGRDYGGEAECTEGAHRCVGDSVGEVCSGGHWGGGVPCAELGQVCEFGLGCVLCHPDMTRCEGDDVMVCAEDGGSWVYGSTCDRAAGETCDPASGVCINPCARAAAERSNIGCEYWAVDLDNAENSVDFAAAAQFAVVVANLSDTYQAEVVIDKDLGLPGDPHDLLEVDRATLDPGDLWIFRLPRWDVDGDNAEGRDDDPQSGLSRRVYRVASSIPVVAYQFNPIEQAFSNAAAVLLPTTALDNDYYGVIWPPANPMVIAGLMPFPNRDAVTIIGVADGTTVTVTPTYDIFEGVGQPGAGILAVPAIAAGDSAEFTLDQFDVLNLENQAMLRLTDPLPDLTGTTVRATGPVAVLMSVDLAVVGNRTLPDGSTESCCAEHMEAQVPPTSSMGMNFVVSRSPPRTSNPSVWLEYDTYRIFAVRDGTHVTTSLTEGDLGDFWLDAGQYREFDSRQGFVVTTDPYPVHVVQFIPARDQCYDWRPSAGGDADMVYIPPVEQRRNTYIFATGEGFSENWAVVSIPEGTTATIDGDDVASTCTRTYDDGVLDGLSYRAYHCPIADGRHDVTSTPTSVGVMVFGYYNAGSYQYPAGSEMRRIFFG